MIRTILVGADGSAHSARAIELAAELAAQLKATVLAVHAFQPLDLLGKVEPPIDFAALEAKARRDLESEWCRPLADAGVTFEALVLEGSPVDVIVDTAEQRGVDLIVVGARGHGTFRQMALGSTSLKLPHETQLPVTIVP